MTNLADCNGLAWTFLCVTFNTKLFSHSTCGKEHIIMLIISENVPNGGCVLNKGFLKASIGTCDMQCESAAVQCASRDTCLSSSKMCLLTGVCDIHLRYPR